MSISRRVVSLTSRSIALDPNDPVLATSNETFLARLHPDDPVERAVNRAWTDYVPTFSEQVTGVAYADDEAAAPESEGGVLLERRHAAHDALVVERRRAPLQRLFDIGAIGVHALADLLQDWLRELRRVGDVEVDPGILLSHVRCLRLFSGGRARPPLVVR